MTKQEAKQLQLKIVKDLNISIKNIKYFSGHDGMQGINADVYFKGNKFAHAYDDAYGGGMDIRPIGYTKDNMQILYDLEKTLNDLPTYTIELGNPPKEIIFNHSLDMLIDMLAEAKDDERDFKKGIIYLDENGDQIIAHWKKSTLINMVKTNPSIVQNRYNKLINEGKKILNVDYLSKLGINITSQV